MPKLFRPSYVQSPKEQARDYDRWRGTAYSRGYDRTWQKVRKAFLRANPLCADCSTPDWPVPADMVHHIIEVDRAPELRLVDSNLEALCNSCHQKRHNH